jgi:hypothetical protein
MEAYCLLEQRFISAREGSYSVFLPTEVVLSGKIIILGNHGTSYCLAFLWGLISGLCVPSLMGNGIQLLMSLLLTFGVHTSVNDFREPGEMVS